MRIIISGGTGFIGRTLSAYMVEKGHEIIILSRTSQRSTHPQITYVKWLGKEDHPWAQIQEADVFINLAGDPLNKGRWTKVKKQRITSSRTGTTQASLEIMRHLNKKPKLFIQASAVGAYGYSLTKTFKETSLPEGNAFPVKVCNTWEKGVEESVELCNRAVIARLGVILGECGALAQMALPYRLFAGGTMGSGKQWVSWIHIDDCIGLIDHIIHQESITGIVNITSPDPVKMKELGQAISNALHRPHWLPVPAFGLRILLGEMSEMLIHGQRVIPQKAIGSGYHFKFPTIDSAVSDLLSIRKNK